MSDAFVLDAVRLPRGEAKPGGGLNSLTPIEMLTQLFRSLEERNKLDPAAVNDVIIGCASQIGEQGGNIARVAALVAGWGDHVPGVTINRFCASGIDAIAHAHARIKAGSDELIVAGGVESVSRVPMYSDGAPLWDDQDIINQVGSIHMGVAADLVATLEGFQRDELDEYGVETQKRAHEAWIEGKYARAVIPATDETGQLFLDHDEHVRPNTTIEQLSALEPAFAGLGEEGQDEIALKRYPELAEIRHLHTRGTSPSLADGACLVLVGSEAAATRIGVEPRARIVSTAARSVDPVIMLTAGQLATKDAIARAGWAPDDVELFEFAEAFAALCVKFQRDLHVESERFNVNGGTIAMGHAFGATGAILVTGLTDELERSGARRGVTAVSGAAGLGVAAALERA